MKKMDKFERKKTFVFCVSSENSCKRIFKIFKIIVFLTTTVYKSEFKLNWDLCCVYVK